MRIILTTALSVICTLVFSQPINDDCQSGIDLGVAPNCEEIVYTNIDATPSTIFSNPNENIPVCWNTVENDVWLEFQVPGNGSVIDFLITVAGTPNGPNNQALFQPQLAVYRGDCGLDELQELACISSGLGQNAVQLALEGLTPGLPYFLRINDFSETASPNWGDFQVCVDSLSNFVEAFADSDTICIGDNVQLTANGSDNLESFSWTPANSLVNPNSENPVAFPTQTTTYEVSGLNEGDNLIINGDFEAGNEGFLSEYIHGPDTLPVGQWGTLSYEGTYEISNNPNLTHSNFASCGDHTTGTGNMLVVNGSSIPNANLWCQTVPVQANTDYLFSAWLTSVTFNNPAILQFSINGSLLNMPFNALFGTCTWTEFESVWNSGISSSAEICITNQNNFNAGNDFALDDISFRTFTEATDTITIYVSNPISFINNQTNATCTGICDGAASVDVSGGFISNEYQYLWNNDETTATIENLCAGDYSVTITDDFGCTTSSNVSISEMPFNVGVVALNSPCEVNDFGVAQAIPNGGTTPYSFSWDNGELTETAEMLEEGIHEVTVVDGNGCTSIGSIEIILNTGALEFPISADKDSICLGEAITLFTTDGPAGTIFEWSTGNGGTAISVDPETTTTYTLTASTPGSNLIINGDFEAGNFGFTSDYDLGLGGAWGLLSLAGTYAIASNTNDVHSNFASCFDHTTGIGEMLIVNGAETANESVWCQTIAIAPNTDYQFSTWVQSAISENPAVLQFSINGVLLGNPFEAILQSCEWSQFFEVWNSGNETSAEICIVNQNIGQSGNDFALDDIALVPLCSSMDEITIVVSDPQATIISQEDVSCQNEMGSAGVNPTGGFPAYSFLWDNGETEALAINLLEGTHTVTVTDAVGCTISANVEIGGAPMIFIDSLFIEDIKCGAQGSDFIEIILASINIENSSGTPPFLYSLNGSDFQSANFFEDIDIGDHEVIVQDADGCEVATPFTIEDNLIFPSIISNTPDGTELCEDLTELTIGILPETSYDSLIWSNGASTETITVTEPGNYSVEIVSESNCRNSAEIVITECGDFEIPSAFSPNGDDINATFGLIASGNVQMNALKIYNRWGQMVHDAPVNWDGTFNGKPHPADVFVYVMVLSTPQGEMKVDGEVTLLR